MQVSGMTNVRIVHPSGTVEEYATTCPLDVYMSTVDPHDMMRYVDEDTGMMPRNAPCFHDITRGPLHDSDVRKACNVFSRVTIWDADTVPHGMTRVYVGQPMLDRIAEIEGLYEEIKSWCPEGDATES